ncbi:carbonic anhydrase [Chryseobacterium salviniae]|uniref:Carbonic anhydrase n=1 Tax=Chryseobacterium salviniae TaxID=3101750 RepID=A0ABU6HRM0_9FLAO|nr:carbonic anhydrase [Chryseobacterium sp. T9W2-O]MEC3875706.1 carbonic anhydrase [Chryseobacterium sp. T9W2-O]
MKKIFIVLIAFFAFQTQAFAQVKKTEKNKKAKITDSVKWRAQHYIVNRDSAYADPRIGLKKLQGGNRRFVEGKSIKPRQNYETIKKLENGQAPFAVIVGCSDSRVPNEMIFDQGLGDLFIIRTAGQVSAAASYGSMEFAVLKLKTKLIVVLGHTECGAVAAAVERPENVPGHIVTLINDIKHAAAKSSHLHGDPVNNAVRQNVIEQVNSLRDLDPILHKKYVDGEILIVGAVYDIHTGKVEFLEETLLNLPKPKAK